MPRIQLDISGIQNAVSNLVRARHWLWISLALFFTGSFVKISYNVLFDREDRSWIQEWDNRILLFVAEFRSPSLTASMIDITALGSITIVSLLGVVFFFALLLLRDYVGIVQLALASAGAGAWTWLFKHFAERPRPAIVHPLVEASGYSFPSGHSLSSAAIYFTFATMWARHISSWKRAVAFQVLAAAVAAAVAFSRVYLGVHYPSDVVSGVLFGAAWAYFIAGMMGWHGKRLSD